VTQPRAADDFPMIRARLEELRRERARPRAADDFRVIRARMEELRRERTTARAGCGAAEGDAQSRHRRRPEHGRLRQGLPRADVRERASQRYGQGCRHRQGVDCRAEFLRLE
jgi:hypothetical protein